MLRKFNKNKIFSLFILFSLFIFGAFLEASIGIDENIQIENYSQSLNKTNKLSPEITVGLVLGDGATIANIPYRFIANANTQYLWHFNLDNVDSISSKILNSNGSITKISSQTGFDNTLFSNGQTDYNLTNDILKTELQEGTIEFWFKPLNTLSASSPPTTNQYLIYKGTDTSTGNNFFTVILSSTTGALQWLTYNDSSLSTTRTDWKNDVWYYISLVFTTNSKKIFVNGVLDNSNNTDGRIVVNNNDFFICGTGRDGNHESFQGYFDELKITTNTTCSEKQIFADYYNAGYSKDNGVTWNSLTLNSTAKTLTISTTTLNFRSSYTDNKILFLAKNSLTEYTTKEFNIRVDTIPANSVSDFVVNPITDTAKKFEIAWKTISDLPIEAGHTNISSYEIRASTAVPNFNSWTNWENQSAVLTNFVSTDTVNIGTQQIYNYTAILPETTYYFTIRAYDGFQYSTHNLQAGLASGLKDITNFKGTAVSDTEIKWTWTDNSSIEQYIDIFDHNYNLVVSSLTANTTYYLETNLQAGVEYIRKIQARDSNFKTNFSSTTANTLSQDKKDIDNDGAYEYFIENTNSLVDNAGANLSILDKNIGKKLFFHVTTRSNSPLSANPIFAWIIEDDYVTDVKLEDVNGDGNLDYVYKSKGSSEYDRVFNASSDADTNLGTITGKIADQAGNALALTEMTIYTQSKTVTATSDDSGNFTVDLPITYGQKTKIVIEKNGYKKYEESFDFINGQENLQNLTVFSYGLSTLKDDIHNYPNPFSRGKSTNISFNVKNDGNVKIHILNVNGRLEKNLLDGYKSTGIYEIIWDGKGANGQLSEGIYYLIYKTKDSKIVKKLVIK
jgi:hypothetical protein